ncbi:MAG: M48 family metalloprotease [Alphaproteobacteria bacterium]|nr:M48 family metalloprotease [Alphaproteobacteria bacterium]MBO6628404.1 M48 family metalloprotease [Alphaproteobacteria bacterium]MDF1626067.1 M48 family metalloprotease [Parvibaculaceae bacterium]
MFRFMGHTFWMVDLVRIFRFWGLLSLGLMAAACTTNVSTGKRQLVLMNLEEEAEIGRAAHPRILAAYGGAYDEGGVADYVGAIVARLGAATVNPGQSPTVYRSTVLDSPIVNAFALPGGYVYVTRGLVALARDEAELAGVIAHEIGHVNARHVAERQAAATGSSLIGGLLGAVVGGGLVDKIVAFGSESLLAGYSRDQEAEADRLAVTYLTLAGYDPFAVRDFLQSMNAYAAFQAQLIGEDYDGSQSGWLSTHPATADRVRDTARDAAETVARLGGASGGHGRDTYLVAVDGLLYGDSPDDGYVRGRRFVHTVDQYQFQVAEGFQLTNTQAAVWALGPNKSILRFDEGVKQAEVDIAHYLREIWAAQMEVRDVRRFQLNGMQAASGRTRLRGLNTLIVAIEFSPTQVYRFLIGTAPQTGTSYEALTHGMIESFRRLSPAEIASTGPLRLAVIRPREGTPVEDAAALMATDGFPMERFRLLNSHVKTETLDGGPVKIIVEDVPAGSG